MSTGGMVFTAEFILESPDLMPAWLVHFDYLYPGSRIGEPELVGEDEQGFRYRVHTGGAS